MKILAQIPLLLFILITYVIVAFLSPGWLGIDTSHAAESVFTIKQVEPVFVMKLVSGATWGLNFGEILISTALLLLFIEIYKSTRTSHASIIDHMLSTFVFIIYVVLFLVWDKAGTSVFFILSSITLIDVLCGFTVSITAAKRDVSIAGGI